MVIYYPSRDKARNAAVRARPDGSKRPLVDCLKDGSPIPPSRKGSRWAVKLD